jgi:putative transposase
VFGFGLLNPHSHSFKNSGKCFRGMQVNQAKRLKELEKENSRLKRAVADLTLDNQILKESSEGNF